MAATTPQARSSIPWDGCALKKRIFREMAVKERFEIDGSPAVSDLQLKDDPYAKFDPRSYLTEYYSEVGSENAFLLEFYHDAFSALPDGVSILEVGGGPTIYQLLSASRRSTEIVFTDFLPGNLQQVAQWLAQDQGSFSWERFAEKVAQLEGGRHASASIVETRTRAAISRLTRCNALSTPLLGSSSKRSFDVVSSNFCLECLRCDEKTFLFALENVSSWVSQNGVLMLTLLKNSRGYQVADRIFPAFPLDSCYMRKALEKLGYSISEHREVTAEQGQGYEGLIALCARRAR